MKKRIFITLGFLVVLSLPLLVLTTDVSAASCNGVETSVDFNCDQYNTDGVSAILMYVINFMAVGVGIAVVIGIIFGGITYAMSDGEESKTKEGREIISNSIIGLFLFMFLYAGANFLIPGGAFNLNAKPPAVASSGGGTATGGGTTSVNRAAALKKLQASSTVTNIRDAGGSGYIKSGILFRSANLNNATSSDKTNLSTLLSGGSIIDLRQSTDTGYKQDPSATNVSNKHIPIKGEASAQGYVDTFINNSTARAQFATTIRAIASATPDSPVLIHCKSGKDRTGWTVALVMMAGRGQQIARYERIPPEP